MNDESECARERDRDGGRKKEREWYGDGKRERDRERKATLGLLGMHLSIFLSQVDIFCFAVRFFHANIQTKARNCTQHTKRFPPFKSFAFLLHSSFVSGRRARISTAESWWNKVNHFHTAGKMEQAKRYKCSLTVWSTINAMCGLNPSHFNVNYGNSIVIGEVYWEIIYILLFNLTFPATHLFNRAELGILCRLFSVQIAWHFCVVVTMFECQQIYRLTISNDFSNC